MVNELIADNAVNKVSEMRRIAGRLPAGVHENSIKSIAVGLEKMITLILNHQPNLLKNKKKNLHHTK